MKKIVILFLLLFLISCVHEKPVEYKPKYENGDVVYIKPDSIKAIVIGYMVIIGKDTSVTYRVRYQDKNQMYHKMLCNEKEIFGNN